MKIIAESPHDLQKKIVIPGNECITLFLTSSFVAWSYNSTKLSTAVAKNGLFCPRIVTREQLICDVTRTWGTGIVTSYSSIDVARANCHRGDLH